MNTKLKPPTKEELSGRVEQFKAIMDQLKHLATLSTGLIVILFAFLQNFVKQGEGHGWARMSIIWLLASVGAGATAFTMLAVRLPRRAARELATWEENV